MIFNKLFNKKKGIDLEQVILNKIEEGKKYIYVEKYNLWSDFVRKSYYGNRFGLDVEAVLIILKELDSDKSINDVLEFLDNDPLACEYRRLIIRNRVFMFSKRGPEFLESILSDEEKSENVIKSIEEMKKIIFCLRIKEKLDSFSFW